MLAGHCELRLFITKLGEKGFQALQNHGKSVPSKSISYSENSHPLCRTTVSKHQSVVVEAPFLSFHHPHRLFSANYIGSITPVKLASAKFSPRSTDKAASNLAPILIMHGLFGSKMNWKSLAKSISAKTGRNVYTLDARNHGDSPHTNEMSYHHMAADVVSFLEDLGVAKAILLGHSMGGRTAMTVALKKPDLVEKLIVVDISPINPPESTIAEMKTFIRGMKEASQSLPQGISISQARALADQIMLTFCKDVGVRQFLLTNLVESSGHITWRVNLDVLDKTIAEGILKFPSFEATFDKDTIFICGANSNYVKKSDLGAVREVFKQAQFFFLPGAGHWVHAEEPEEFVRLVVEFVNQGKG